MRAEDQPGEEFFGLEEAENPVRPTKDFQLVRDSEESDYTLVELEDPGKLAFASTTRWLSYTYANTKFQIFRNTATTVIQESKSLGPRYAIYKTYCPQHALKNMLTDQETLELFPAILPTFAISGCQTLGYVFPDFESDDLSEDVAECLLVADQNIVKEDPNFIEPEMVYFGPNDNFSTLVGKEFLLSGFPIAFDNSSGYFTRVTFDLNLIDIVPNTDEEDTRYLFKFKPSNSFIKGNILPNVSGGAIGYVNENGVPCIIATLYGYDSEGYWLGSSLAGGKSDELINGASLDQLSARPTTRGLGSPRLEDFELDDVRDINSLVWYMLKNTNYPLNQLEEMAHFADNLRIYEQEIEKVKIWKKRPIIFAKDKDNKKTCFIWDPKKSQFVEFSG